MLNFIILFVLIIISATTRALEPMQLIEGSRQNLNGQGQVWVEDGSVIKIEREQGHWTLQGLKAGRSEFHIGEKHYQAMVLSRAQGRTMDVLSAATERTLQLRAIKSNNHIYVTGRILRWQDWEQLASACADETCEYEMRASATHEIEEELKQQLKRKLKNFSLFPYRLEFTDRFQIHVNPKLPQFEKFVQLMTRYGITPVKDLTSVEMQPLVKVQITVAEIKKDAFLNYGIQWPSSYSAQVIPSPSGESLAAGLSLTLQTLESRGLGKVLASPNLLCRSGKEAEFVAGGEFPIKIMNFKMQDVVWKRYGIVLKIKPIADFSGRMSISLETEISSLDGHTVDGIPGLLTNRVQSHFDLSESKTIALSGLIKSENTESQAGLPGLTRIPILGSLFSSKEFRENRTELVIFVKPEIVNLENEAPEI